MGGAIATLQDSFDAVTGLTAGSVLVTRTGDEAETSAYGYAYGIDFAGADVRGDMDLRCVVRNVFSWAFSFWDVSST